MGILSNIFSKIFPRSHPAVTQQQPQVASAGSQQRATPPLAHRSHPIQKEEPPCTHTKPPSSSRSCATARSRVAVRPAPRARAGNARTASDNTDTAERGEHTARLRRGFEAE